MNDQIDEIDEKLLALLTEDARSPVATLARTLGLARTTVQARIDRLVSRGLIAGFTVRAGAKLKPAIRATALVSIEPRSGPGVLQRLRILPGVEVVHTTSGRFDLIVQIAAPSTEALDAILDEIGAAKGVQSSESLIHLSTKIDRSR